MSGHSHFKTVRRKKELSDQKRGQIFSKLSKQISVAVREKGKDQEMNPKLRLAIEMAKNWNMPSENIERAIKKGLGETEDAKLQGILLEAYGPGGIAIIIEGITDNKNRALGEIKRVLSEYHGKLAETGSVQWLFERRGVITIAITNNQIPPKDPALFGKKAGLTGQVITKEEVELKVIEAGAEDIHWHNDILDVYTKIEDLGKVKQKLESQKVKVESASLDWVAKEQILVGEKEKEQAQKLFEALDENDAVQEIYSNLKV